MDENRIHEKLDKLIGDVTEIKITQVQQQSTLNHHVYRCDLLEESNKTLKEETASAFKEIRDDIKPLKTFRDYFIGASKLIGLLAAVSGVIIGILRFIFH